MSRGVQLNCLFTAPDYDTFLSFIFSKALHTHFSKALLFQLFEHATQSFYLIGLELEVTSPPSPSEPRMLPPHDLQALFIIHTGRRRCQSSLTRALHFFSPGNFKWIAMVFVKFFVKYGLYFPRVLLLSLLGVKHSHKVFASLLIQQFCKNNSCN